MLDASVVVEYLLRSQRGRRVAERLADPDDVIHVPHLLSVDVIQVLRRLVINGELGHDRGEAAVTDLADLAAVRHPHEDLLPRVWQLRDNLTAYDAAYVALAESIGAPLLTSDARLAAAPGHAATIELIV